MNIKSLTLLVMTAFLVGGCDKSPTSTANKSGSQPPTPIQAEAFHGHVYKSHDGRTVLTLISKDECELSEHGTILLCKYTKQNDNLRVVTTALGTSQVLYYRFTKQGLQDKDGQVLLSPEVYLEVQRQEELERLKQLQAEAAEKERLAREATAAAELAAEQARLEEARRIADRPRVEKNIVGRWGFEGFFGSNEITITKDDGGFAAVAVWGNVREVLRGELLRDSRLELTPTETKLIDPNLASDWSYPGKMWIELGADNASMITSRANGSSDNGWKRKP